MSRPVTFCAAILLASAVVAGAIAKEPSVVITVEKSQPPSTPDAAKPFDGRRPSVDVAILLDTSNSMDGLISQAKSQLWTIVQQFAKAKKRGQTPVLRVALFEYGNTRLPASEGYIRQVVPLTDDLDKLSEALFALTTSGGDEYCGQVIDEAITRLDWSKETNGYKAIFIAGNEPFTQGPVNYREACRRAIQKGVVVNTIHCGDSAAGISGMWQHGAQLAEGEFFNIDQDRAVVHINCPQDEIIIKLNAELNGTYLWYGKREERARYAENQVAQDANAAQLGAPVVAARGAIKAGSAYNNGTRDLVDALKEDRGILKKLQKQDLPEALQELAPAERQAEVDKAATRRAEIQTKITKLAGEREKYLEVERKRVATESGEATLGDAVVATIQKQLTKSGFETESKD
jgi:von Willebrand factor type A domain